MKGRLIIGLLALLATADFSQAQVASADLEQHAYITKSGETISIKRISLNTGVRLEYAEQGVAGGIPVIFLHGITDSWHSFESTFSFLPASIHAIAVSQRGHGNSERPQSEYQPKDFAADIAALITQLNLGPVFIVGHSMGGVNAQQFVLNYPQLTRGVVIVDADFSFRDNAGMPEFYEEVMKFNGPIDSKFMDEFQKATLAKPIDSAYFRLLVNEGLKVPARVFKAALTGLMNVDFSKRFDEIKAPVLIFWGDKDSFCDWKSQELMKNSIKEAKLLVYNHTGHALHWEQPERFAADLVNFIHAHSFKIKK